ncbi:serine protease [Bradyrhizobium sp. G127]|uniref:S1 family peptidase n=1 Tax=Bradyrhizobium sp. G127 TaxID=2904800 RepID=UPI001F264636|nr:serine protease [Bradyrhizobium sp. G127]MCF2522400.1 serine protease [Bradyrhizobium sp. G127]
MTMKFETLLALSPPQELRALIQLLSVVFDKAEYEKLVRAQLGKSGDFSSREALLLNGFFASHDLWQLLMGCGCSGGVNTTTVSAFLKKIEEWGLVAKLDLPNARAPYQWNTKMVALFGRLGIIDNIVLGPVYIAQKYRQSVPSILVFKDGKERIGTGFVVGKGEKFFVVTAKHNVDPSDGIEFLRIGDADDVKYEPVGSSWTLDAIRDIAAIEVRIGKTPATQSPVTISLLGRAHLLARTVTLGYPLISSTDQAYLLAHGGELNAIVTSYLDKQQYLLISNRVAPGNSGGPVLDEAGLCIGMVVRALEGEYEGGVSKANAAIPSNELRAFIESIP